MLGRTTRQTFERNSQMGKKKLRETAVSDSKKRVREEVEREVETNRPTTVVSRLYSSVTSVPGPKGRQPLLDVLCSLCFQSLTQKKRLWYNCISFDFPGNCTLKVLSFL